MRLIATLRARPLDAAAFARFGHVTARPCPADPATGLGGTVAAPVGPAVNLRPGRAEPRLAWFAAAARSWPVVATAMERHRYSTQSFVPGGEADWLVAVAPDDPDGGPDMARAAAFRADGRHAVTFAAGVWHLPLTAFAATHFAVVTALAFDSDDEEFRALPAPVEIHPG